jgi:hypothetical protein
MDSETTPLSGKFYATFSIFGIISAGERMKFPSTERISIASETSY